MINEILTVYAEKLENFLETIFHQPEGIVKLGGFTGGNKEEGVNKLLVSVVSVERETTAGIPTTSVKNAAGGFNKVFPPLNINLNVVFAAVYDQKRYTDSLAVLSAVILFIQAHSSFYLSGKQKYRIEILTLSADELNNIWSCLGGNYYPSVICKIRGLVFDSGEVYGTIGNTQGLAAETAGKYRERDRREEEKRE